MSDPVLPVITGAVSDPKVQAILAYQQAIAEGRINDARQVFQTDVLYTVPGANSMSGEYRGADAVMGYFGRLMDLTGGTYAITAMHWMVSEDHEALMTANTASRAGHALTWGEVLAFTFVDGRKSRIRHFVDDQAAVDALFTA